MSASLFGFDRPDSQVSDSGFVVTGGRTTFNTVVDYDKVAGSGWGYRQLAPLGVGRRMHACGSYTGDRGQVRPPSYSCSVAPDVDSDRRVHGLF